MEKLIHRVVFVAAVILRAAHVDTSTHWIVTEDGKLQEQTDSMLSMKRPHDLVAFMHQEERVKEVEELKEYIVKHQDVVENTDDKDDGFEERFLAAEESCVKAVKRLPEFDLYISTVLPLENKGIKADDHINLNLPQPLKYLPPYCNSPLDFSMYAFEHLEGVQIRSSLQGLPELGLKSAITDRDSEDEYGHLVYDAMRQNQTSWVLYNMAAFYWRIKGNPNEAIECLRRAMHYSPGDYRDIAYVSLGNILHRSRYSHEAAIVVEAALGLSHALNVNHFTLGNIYAVLTEYNKSIACFDNTLAIQPDFEAAEKRRWAVICHAKLEQALEGQHKNLQVALEKLKEYQRKHESMKSLTEKVNREQSTRTDRVTRNAEYNQHVHNRRHSDTATMGEHCELTRPGDEQSIECLWKRHTRETDFSYNSSDADVRFSNIPITDEELERIREHAIHERQLLKHEGIAGEVNPNKPRPHDSRQDYSKPLRPPTYAAGEATTPPAADTAEDKPQYVDTAWPTRQECEEHQSEALGWNDYPTTFLPPENKGFDSRVFLTEAIDIQMGEQHQLPWYPPVCVNIVDLKQGEMFLDHIASIRDRDQVPLRLNDPSMKQIMLNWVNNGEVEEEEVGQRILTALKQNLAPRWLLYNLAGLYWRVVGNNYHGIECLRRSLHFVPADYVDVPLVNMANIFYKWNKLDDALNMTRQALIFCPFEPITHFTQANLLAAKKNESGAVYHYEKALEYDPNYTPALNMLRNLKCYSKYHKAALAQADKNMCKAGSKSKQNCNTGPLPIPNCASLPLCSSEHDLIDPSDNDARRRSNGVVKAKPDHQYIDIKNTVLTLGAFLRKSKMIDPTEADAMKEFHKTNGLCAGAECDHIVHKPGTNPYIKIKSVGAGKWLQRLLFISPDDVIEPESDECFLLKDRERKGCQGIEFTENEKRLEQLERVLEELYAFMNEQAEAGELLVDDEQKFIDRVKAKEAGEFINLDGFVDIVCVTDDVQDQIRCFSKKDASPDQIELPEVKPRQVTAVPGLVTPFHPSELECDNAKDINFKTFTSTWLSVSVGGIEYINNQVTLSDIGEFIDLEEEIDPLDIEQPFCEAKFSASVSMFDHLPSIADKDKLIYSPENVLKDVIEGIGTKKESADIIGTRISRALHTNRTSWALGCLGALYWRVKGDASNAISCLRMALMNASHDNKHIPLLSLANILHKAGAINDALEIALAALESSPETVVIHFSIGNMYAAKDDFVKAVEYYQSTLALQDEFEPARERLITIMCHDLLPDNSEDEDDEDDE